MIWEALLALWHIFYNFWDQFRYLGVTFGAFWMHLLCQKTDWGAKGAPRGPTPEIKASIWAPFGDHFSYDCVFLMEKSVYLTHVAFFLNFWGALSALGDGLICNPYTYMQSKHTFHFFHVFFKKLPGEFDMGPFWHNV